jgi:hypothetical protein
MKFYCQYLTNQSFKSEKSSCDTLTTSSGLGRFHQHLRAAFTPIAPKSVRIQLSRQYLFTPLGSTGAKAAHRTLMKLTPRVDFINILCNICSLPYLQKMNCFTSIV